MDRSYDADVLEWSERQASILRRIAAGEPGNEAPDRANIIEEIESENRSEFKVSNSPPPPTHLGVKQRRHGAGVQRTNAVERVDGGAHLGFPRARSPSPVTSIRRPVAASARQRLLPLARFCRVVRPCLTMLCRLAATRQRVRALPLAVQARRPA